MCEIKGSMKNNLHILSAWDRLFEKLSTYVLWQIILGGYVCSFLLPIASLASSAVRESRVETNLSK